MSFFNINHTLFEYFIIYYLCHIILNLTTMLMNKKITELATLTARKSIYILSLLALSLTGCSDDDKPEYTAKLSFEVYEYTVTSKADVTVKKIPAAQAEVKIYSKTGEQYNLIKALKTNDAGIAEYEGEYKTTVYYEVKKGNSSNLYNDYIIAGIFESQEDIDNSPRQDANTQPGDLKFKDVNGDGIIREDDKITEKYLSETLGRPNTTSKITVYIATK